MNKYYKIVDGQTVFFTGNILNTTIELDDKTLRVSIINPSEELMLEADWLIYEKTAEELLQEAKINKILEIEAYDNSIDVNLFSINDNSMWLGHELRQQIKTSVEAYLAAGQENVTKVFNGEEYTFPCTLWLLMLSALEIYASEALNTTERHKNAVLALDNIEDIEAYDYTTGYPEKMVFTTE